MSFTNRIPRDSVSFSNIKTKIFHPFNESLDSNSNGLNRREALENEMELSKKEQENLELINKIKQEKEQLIVLQQNLIQEREEMILELQKEKEKFNKEKALEMQKMRDFMWEASVKIAERVVRQELNRKELDLTVLFKNILKELPISFNKLEVVVHPETVELIKKMNSKEVWLFEDIIWKYNFDLEIGDFIIEHENEIYNATITEQFKNIKKEIEELREDNDE